MKPLIEELQVTYTGDMADVEQLETDRNNMIFVLETYRKVASGNDIENSFLIYKNQLLPKIQTATACTENIKAHEETLANSIHTDAMKTLSLPWWYWALSVQLQPLQA